MLEPTVQALSKGRIILASGSPRRYEIIKNIGVNAEVIPSTFDENLDRRNYNCHKDYVQDLAYHKVLTVYEKLKNDDVPPSLVIGADTVVTMGDVIYGKPKNDSDAFNILSCLAGKKHIVYTGVCLKTSKREVKFCESTEVYFGEVTEDQIRAYVKTGEPRDKAGGYGIQGVGGCLVEKINGDFYTVMGLPLYTLIKHLNRMLQ